MKLPLFENLLQVFYPHLCPVCNEHPISSEQFLCTSCMHGIPRTEFHKIADNPVEKRFWGKVNVYRATSFFRFQKGSMYRVLLHELKYKNNPEIGIFLGALAASEMEQSWMSTVDLILPVPLHPRKFAIRGYNQSEYITRGLSRVLTHAECRTDVLIRTKENTTQTRKNVFQRYENTAGIFAINPSADLTGKHILIVDDVLTTGSTIEACIKSIPDFPEMKISVFTLALA